LSVVEVVTAKKKKKKKKDKKRDIAVADEEPGSTKTQAGGDKPHSKKAKTAKETSVVDPASIPLPPSSLAPPVHAELQRKRREKKEKKKAAAPEAQESKGEGEESEQAKEGRSRQTRLLRPKG